jgi:hypothetical protein
MDIQKLIQRTQHIFTEPKREFIRISKEQDKVLTLFIDFVLPFMIIYFVAAYLGTIFFTPATFNIGAGIILKSIVLNLLVMVTGIYVSSLIINEMLPLFQLKKDIVKISSIIIYSLTPVYIALIASGLFPNISMFINLIGFYSIILFWISTATIINMTKEHRQIFVPVISIALVLIFLFIRIILGAIFSL